MIKRIFNYLFNPLPNWTEEELSDFKKALQKIDDMGDEIVIHKSSPFSAGCIERRKKRQKHNI